MADTKKSQSAAAAVPAPAETPAAPVQRLRTNKPADSLLERNAKKNRR